MPRTMLGERQAQIPADLVIWGSTAALGLVSGLGAAFVLWNLLHRSPAQGTAAIAVAALTLGAGLIGFAVPRRLTVRVFVLVASAATFAAFFLGADAFTTLAG